ncbi:hypothetical protein [Lactobacillus taiwanensis]|uniref:hypothetical protein n=1 Tax=Lactobacillus taiwanensis TaxID=508451 RepID=UPI00322018F3
MLFKKPRSKGEIITKFSDIKKDNLYRQNYVKSDLSKKKVEVLFERGGRPSIIPIDIMCNNSAKIVDLCKEYKIDIVIQAGDYPSTRELAKLTEIAANELNISYVINAGYISNVVSLAEFYYPNNVYDFLYKHEIYKEKRIFTNANNKAQSSIVANVGHIVVRQISDYCAGKKPFKYRERVFFDIGALEWRTEKIE